jgi:hypothetical protein
VRREPNNRKVKPDKWWAHDPVSDGISMLGVLTTIFGPMAVIGFQAFLWLRDGIWLALPARLIWDAVAAGPPAISWVGVERLLLSALDLPLSLALFGLGVALIIFGSAIRFPTE